MSSGRQRLSQEWQRLQTVDWRALDIKEAGEWPWLLKVLSSLLVFLIVFVVASWWLASEKREQLATERRQEVRLLSEYRSHASEVVLLSEIRSQLEVLEEQMSHVRAMLPTDAEVPSLLDSISSAAENNQLTIEAIRLKPLISNTHYVEHPLDIQVRGGYHQLAQFTADISQLARLVTQHDLTLAPVEPDSDTLRLSLLASTYSYISPAEAGNTQ